MISIEGQVAQKIKLTPSALVFDGYDSYLSYDKGLKLINFYIIFKPLFCVFEKTFQIKNCTVV